MIVGYPLYGYAPGEYRCRCRTCTLEFVGDKRARTCEPCALKARIAELELIIALTGKPAPTGHSHTAAGAEPEYKIVSVTPNDAARLDWLLEYATVSYLSGWQEYQISDREAIDAAMLEAQSPANTGA